MVDLTQIGKRDVLSKFLALSRFLTKAKMDMEALPRVAGLAREVIIFDNLAIFVAEKCELKPYFARAIGRGRSQAEDIAWGMEVAADIYDADETIAKREELEGAETNRLFLRYYLGIPLKVGERKIGVLVFIRFGGPEYDITQIRLAEFIAEQVAHLIGRNQLESKVRALETGQKLGEIQEDFVATVSHNLRTPLGFIKGYSTTLLREDAEWDKETFREFLEIIDDEADELRKLIDDLLDTSRLQSGTLQMKSQNLRLDIFLRDIVSRAEMFDFDKQIRFNNSSTNVTVKADATRLAQVFENLFSNINKYAPEAKVTLNLSEENGQAHIVVYDNGPGLSKEHLEKIFTRFYRVPETHFGVRGSGLGLYICKQIIEAHHGEIFAKSTLGEGTAIHIYLPIVTRPATTRKETHG